MKYIEVKPKHIRKGIKEDACNCPVALALKDAGIVLDREFHGKWTGVDDIGIETPNKSFVSTRSVFRFVRKFDKTGKGKPFRFRLIEKA